MVCVKVVMIVEIEKLGRGSLKKAKTEFSETYPDPTPMLYGSDRRRRYWEDFGKANNLEVIITEWHYGYPVIGALEFNDEQSYIWFMMRWL